VPEAEGDKLSRKRSKLETALKQLRDQERVRDLKRHAIVGRAVLARAGRDPAYREALTRLLSAELRKASERELFGLPAEDGTDRRGRARKVEEAPPEPAERTGEPEALPGGTQG
jgi:hypothetical protein